MPNQTRMNPGRSSKLPPRSRPRLSSIVDKTEQYGDALGWGGFPVRPPETEGSKIHRGNRFLDSEELYRNDWVPLPRQEGLLAKPMSLEQRLAEPRKDWATKLATKRPHQHNPSNANASPSSRRWEKYSWTQPKSAPPLN